MHVPETYALPALPVPVTGTVPDPLSGTQEPRLRQDRESREPEQVEATSTATSTTTTSYWVFDATNPNDNRRKFFESHHLDCHTDVDRIRVQKRNVQATRNHDAAITYDSTTGR